MGSGPRRGNQPILHEEPRHAFEVPDVSSDHRQVSRERDRRDTGIGLTYGDPRPFELSANASIDFSGRSVEGQYRDVWPDTSLKLVEQFVSSGTSVGAVSVGTFGRQNVNRGRTAMDAASAIPLTRKLFRYWSK